MARTSVELELTAQVEKAERALGKFTKDTQAQLNSISFSSAVSGIAAGFQLAAGFARQAAAAFEFTVGEAISAEQSIAKLAKQMKLVGDFSQDAVDNFVAFADSLEKTTGVSDDAIIAAASLAKNYGLVNSEAKLAVEAALGLSQATGDDLNTSVEKVSRTFNGFIDRDLKRLVPGLNGLTEAQIRAGEAALLISKRFPSAFSGTTADQISKFKNAISDLGKELGFIFLPIVNDVTLALTGLINRITGGIQSALQFTGIKAPKIEIQGTGPGLAEVAAENAIKKQREAQVILNKQKEADEEREKQRRAKLETDIASLKIDLSKAGLNDIEKLEKDFADKRLVIEQAFSSKIIKSDVERIRLLSQLELDEKKALFEASIAFREKEAALAKKIAEEERAAKFGNISQDSATQAAAGSIGNVTQGEQGAASTISSVVGGVVNAFLPGIGSIIQKIIDVLAGGPEKVKQFLESFIQGIPRVLTNILSSIPQVILSILREIPKSLIEFIKNGIPEIIQAFVENIPIIIQELIKYIPQLIIGLVNGLIEAIPKIVKGFITALVNQAGDFIDALVRALADVGSFFENVGSGIGDFFGGIFAQGGRVPNKPQYEGDRFPARLNAGEQVLDKDLTSRLEQYLNGGGGSGPSRIVIQIGQRELANVLLDVNNRGFRTA